MDLFTLLELSQLRAINTALKPSVESIWRSYCRSYSAQFHTPLHVVMNELDPVHVLQALDEAKFTPGNVEEDLEGIVEKLQTIKDPDYAHMSKQDVEDMVDAVMNKEIARLSKKKRPTQETIQQEVRAAESKPKSGSMNFQDLERMESQVEANKSGFDK